MRPISDTFSTIPALDSIMIEVPSMRFKVTRRKSYPFANLMFFGAFHARF
jgi:hypothetical protein